MALTRKFLKAMGIDDDKIEEIISAHSETVTALKDQAEQYKTDAEKLPGVQKQLDDAKKAAEDSGEDAWKVKYDALKEDFDAYKTDVTGKETLSKKQAAYTALLKAAGVSEKRIPAVLRVTKLDDLELAEDGKFKTAEDLTKAIKTDWADFIGTVTETGAHVDTPPANDQSGADYDKMSDAEYYAAMAAKKGK